MHVLAAALERLAADGGAALRRVLAVFRSDPLRTLRKGGRSGLPVVLKRKECGGAVVHEFRHADGADGGDGLCLAILKIGEYRRNGRLPRTRGVKFAARFRRLPAEIGVGRRKDDRIVLRVPEHPACGEGAAESDGDLVGLSARDFCFRRRKGERDGGLLRRRVVRARLFRRRVVRARLFRAAAFFAARLPARVFGVGLLLRRVVRARLFRAAALFGARLPARACILLRARGKCKGGKRE